MRKDLEFWMMELNQVMQDSTNKLQFQHIVTEDIALMNNHVIMNTMNINVEIQTKLKDKLENFDQCPFRSLSLSIKLCNNPM